MSPEPHSEAAPSVHPWLIAAVVALAAFMEVLDTSIANVALPHIAGSLSASVDESTWVLTSYLVSNAIVLPASGWIAGRVGRKRFFMLCIVLFTTSSFLCGIAPTLGAIILFRVIQGAGGGGLQPMAQAILADTFQPELLGQAFAIYGVTTVVAPVIGPTLGGWITDNYSWRWIFFINIPVGVLALLLISRLVEDPPYFHKLAKAGVKIDFIGMGLLALGVGCLQVMLDKGQEDDWFGSHFIVTLAVLCAISLVTLAIWEWRNKNPLIDVHLFKNFNFLSANLMMFVLGVLLFSSLVMLPLFLQTLMGYTAESAGIVLSFGALVVLVELPMIGKLTTMVQARRLVAFGWLLVALSMFYTTRQLDLEVSFKSMAVLRIIQSLGFPFLFIPLTMAAYFGLPPEKNNSIAGMMNFMRNIGSSVGTSMVTTLIARRAQFHQQVLVVHANATSNLFNGALRGLSQTLLRAGLSATAALSQAYGRIYQALIGQATTLAYIDTFHVLAAGSLAMFVLSFVLKKNKPGRGSVTPA